MENTNPNQSQQSAILLPQKKWHNHKGLKVTLMLILVAGFVIFMYLSRQQDLKPVIIPIHKQVTQLQNPSPEQKTATSSVDLLNQKSQAPSATTTPGWQSYNNDNYGFQVSYPKSWKVVVQNTDNKPQYILMPDSDVISASLHIMPWGPSLDNSQFYKDTPKIYNIKIGGKNAVRSDQKDFTKIQILTQLPEWSLESNRIDIYNGDYDYSKDAIIAILNSIIFYTPSGNQNTDATITSSWLRAENRDMGIAVKYPPNWNIQSQNSIGMIISDSYPQNNSGAVSITYDQSVLSIIGGNPSCNATADFQSGDFGPNMPMKVICKFGIKIELAVGDRDPEAISNKVILQAMADSITQIKP